MPGSPGVAARRVARSLQRLPASDARVRIARQLASSIRQLTRQANGIETELRALVRAYRPRLLDELGCGTLTAATLIGRTAGAERFDTDARFARQAGTAPIPVSSGKPTATDCTAAAIANSTARCTPSPSPALAATPRPAPTWTARWPKARPAKKPCAASNATSPDAFTDS